MGILYGLLTALTWGSADLFARFATRKIGTLRTMLYMQLTGFILLTLAMRWLGGWGHLADGSGWRPWAWGILAGVLNASGTMALYRSFEIGKMSIVAPLSASYPVLTLLLSVLTGERLTLARLVGMALAILGVILVARGETLPDDANEIDAATQPAKKRLGVGWALLAAVAFGVMFWLLGIRVVPAAGRDACGLDHSIDEFFFRRARDSDCGKFFGAADEERLALDSGRGDPRYERVRVQQSGHAARTGFRGERACFALWSGDGRAGCADSARAGFASAVARHFFHFCGDHPDQPLRIHLFVPWSFAKSRSLASLGMTTKYPRDDNELPPGMTTNYRFSATC